MKPESYLKSETTSAKFTEGPYTVCTKYRKLFHDSLMLSQDGVIVLSDDHPVDVSFLFIVQTHNFAIIAKLFTIYALIYWHFYIWKSAFNHFNVILKLHIH